MISLTQTSHAGTTMKNMHAGTVPTLDDIMIRTFGEFLAAHKNARGQYQKNIDSIFLDFYFRNKDAIPQCPTYDIFLQALFKKCDANTYKDIATYLIQKSYKNNIHKILQ